MTIESKLDALTAAITELTKQLAGAQLPVTTYTAPQPVIQAPVQQVVPPAQVPTVALAPVIEMPTPPVFTPSNDPVFQEPVVAALSAPFTDHKGLTDYVVGVYTALGPVKGAAIQNVITSLGYENINDIKPEHYGALFAGVEALKG